MADTTGSSAGTGTGPRPGAAAAAGHGDLGRGITQEQYQAFLTSSVNRIAPGAANIYPQTQQHHYSIGLIPAPVGMAMSPAQRAPVYSTQIVLPPQQLAPPYQPSPLAGSYQQDYSAYGNTGSSTAPSLGFPGWRMYGNALMSFTHQTPFGRISGNGNISLNGGGFQQNSSPFSTTMWTAAGYTNQPYYTNYGTATNDPALQQAASFHINNNNQQLANLGFAANFAAASTLVSGSPFEVTSQRPTNCSSAQIVQEVKNIDGTLRASGSVEVEGREASEESDPQPELKAQIQLGQGVGDISSTDNTILNCKNYRTVLRKDLTNSDCGNIGRIVLPKRDAEANLPALVDKDGIILEMDDLELPDVWKFKYRYWPNNKSRMYILETAGEFIKKHDLEAGDVFIIYQHKRTDRHVARAVKACHLSTMMTALECQCMNEGSSTDKCGFVVPPPIKKT